MRLFNERSENCDRKLYRKLTRTLSKRSFGIGERRSGLVRGVVLLYDFGNQPALRNELYFRCLTALDSRLGSFGRENVIFTDTD